MSIGQTVDSLMKINTKFYTNLTEVSDNECSFCKKEYTSTMHLIIWTKINLCISTSAEFHYMCSSLMSDVHVFRMTTEQMFAMN